MSAKQEVVQHIEPSAPAEADAFIQMIERASANPNLDVDKFERLLAMKERVETRAAEQAFNAAMAEAQAAMKPILRDATNPDNRSKYARLETLIEAINPIITKNGFSMSFGSDQSPLEKHYRVTCIVAHKAGHSRPYHADIPADLTGLKGNPNKTATHAFGSTMSYGRRYLTLLIFNVALVNDDDDGNKAGGTESISEELVETLRKQIVEVGADLPAFLKYFKVEQLGDITMRDYPRAMEALKKFEKQEQAKSK